MSSLTITYLHHSGFAVETANYVLVFDYYQDPARKMPQLLQCGKKVVVFSSHAHGDHFSPSIGQWQQVAGYVLSDDIAAGGGLKAAQPKLHYVKPYEQVDVCGLDISTYGSTDEGVSFAVQADGWRLFHAGDLNWWHWKGDTPENLRLAEEGFRAELARLAGQHFDLAFFPVDSRLEECRTMGVDAFSQAVTVNQLVTMHSCGEVWQAPEGYPGNGKQMAVWSPASAGEALTVTKE